MVKVFVVYDAEPDRERYACHAGLRRLVPGSTFRHCMVFRTSCRPRQFRCFTEWESGNLDAFKGAARSPAVAQTGSDTG